MPPQTERVVTLGGDANTTALPRPLMAESRSESACFQIEEKDTT
jgi:hypothetical protein